MLSEEFVKGRTKIFSNISLNRHNKNASLMSVSPFHKFLIVDKSKNSFTGPSKLNTINIRQIFESDNPNIIQQIKTLIAIIT